MGNTINQQLHRKKKSQTLYNQDKEFKNERTKQKNVKKKENDEMIDHSTILYILYAIFILGGFLALGYHLFAGEEDE